MVQISRLHFEMCVALNLLPSSSPLPRAHICFSHFPFVFKGSRRDPQTAVTYKQKAAMIGARTHDGV